MSGDFTIYFEGSAESYARKCSFANETGTPAMFVGISGRTAQFPVTWDKFGQMEGAGDPDTPFLVETYGEDTEVIQFYFAYFSSGKVVIFNAIDPDFTHDTNSGVQVGALAGSRVSVFFEDGYRGFGELEILNGRLLAIISKP